MEIKERLILLERQHESYKQDLEELLSGGVENVAPDEVTFTVDQINRIEKEIASLQDVL